MSEHINLIVDAQEHERVVEESKTTPTVICVSHPATPVSTAFVKKYETVVAEYKSNQNSTDSSEKRHIRFCVMEFNKETSMLYKFSPNQLPVVALMCLDRWAKTIMGANIAEVENAVDEMMVKYKELNK